METHDECHPGRDTDLGPSNALARSGQSAGRPPDREPQLQEPPRPSALTEPFRISESTAVPRRSRKLEPASGSRHGRAGPNGSEQSLAAESLTSRGDAPVARSNVHALSRVQRDIERARRTMSQASREAHERATQLVERSREAIARARALKQSRTQRSLDPAQSVSHIGGATSLSRSSSASGPHEARLTAAAGQPRSR
jgi:hypothetical protein